eukprot:scaffold14071_cov65-Phaeocystis_antarctica.AAC.4
MRATTASSVGPRPGSLSRWISSSSSSPTRLTTPCASRRKRDRLSAVPRRKDWGAECVEQPSPDALRPRRLGRHVRRAVPLLRRGHDQVGVANGLLSEVSVLGVPRELEALDAEAGELGAPVDQPLVGECLERRNVDGGGPRGGVVACAPQPRQRQLEDHRLARPRWRGDHHALIGAVRRLETLALHHVEDLVGKQAAEGWRHNRDRDERHIVATATLASVTDTAAPLKTSRAGWYSANRGSPESCICIYPPRAPLRAPRWRCRSSAATSSASSRPSVQRARPTRRPEFQQRQPRAAGADAGATATAEG